LIADPLCSDPEQFEELTTRERDLVSLVASRPGLAAA
jgi:hypothetical protein